MGGNIKAARLSGINTNKLMFTVYVVSGLMATIAGIMVCARLNASTLKPGWMRLTRLQPASWGASISGGSGTVYGARRRPHHERFEQRMSLLGVSIDWQSAIKGLVVLVAVAFDMYFKAGSMPPFKR